MICVSPDLSVPGAHRLVGKMTLNVTLVQIRAGPVCLENTTTASW